MAKISYYGEKRIFSKWINYGYSFTGINIGFHVDKYQVNIDFFFVWVGIEF